MQKMQNKKKRIFIIAGEVSGDVLGGHIMSHAESAEFIGIGGENMQRAGLQSLFPMSDLSVMGIVEVVAHAKTLTKRIKQTVNAILEYQPDLVLTIDSPGFAKSVIKQIRNSDAGKSLIANGMRFHHVVAPQVWVQKNTPRCLINYMRFLILKFLILQNMVWIQLQLDIQSQMV